MTPNTGSVIAVAPPRRMQAVIEAPPRRPVPKIAAGTKFEPYAAGNSGCHPPRNSTVAMQHTVIMLAYSAMKKEANFMLLYSVWKPATSSFSASGRSNGMRLVSANAGDQENDEADDLRERSLEDVPAAAEPERVAALPLHQLAQAQRIRQQQRRGDGQRHRQFVADHLRRAAQPAEQRVLVVRRPAGQRDAVDAHRGNRQHEQHADVQIGELHPGRGRRRRSISGPKGITAIESSAMVMARNGASR